MAGIQYLLWLSTRRVLSHRHQVELLEQFGGAERVYFAGREDFEPLGLTEEARRSLCDKSLDQPQRILERCDRLGLFLLSCQDGAYPERLLQLPDYPLVLYGKGRLFRFDEEAAIAMVGSRKCTPYGVKMAGRIAMGLARAGALVVSGLAQGIDAASLKGALQGGGPVVSVLAGGVDVIYPACNGWLYEDVAARGAILSENPPGTRPDGWRFPLRNRILSGLCLGVVAVECRPHSGTMITVDRALEQNRDLFAVPGNIDAPMSQGPNLLIQQGAKLVTSGRDILEEYWDRFPAKLSPGEPLSPAAAAARLETAACPAPAPAEREEAPAAPGRERIPAAEQRDRFTDDELALIAALGGRRRSADELVEAAQIPARRVLSALTMLQVQGAVEEGPDRRFSALVELEE